MATRVVCCQCQKEFVARRYWQKFCSETCRIAWHAEERQQGILLYRKQRERVG